MLDVHPPHQAAHTWKDFFIHIATICVGLLIAIGLEQTVEAIHHHREKTELRDAMQRDEDKAILECERGNQLLTDRLHWTADRIVQTQQAIQNKQPLEPIADPPRPVGFDLPIDPAWKAAKASGVLSLIPQEEIKAFSEIDDLHEHVHAFWFDWIKAQSRRAQLDHNYPADLTASPVPVPVPVADLPEYLDRLRADYFAANTVRHEIQRLHGAQTAARNGERDLDQIQNAEVQPASTASTPQAK